MQTHLKAESVPEQNRNMKIKKRNLVPVKKNYAHYETEMEPFEEDHTEI